MELKIIEDTKGRVVFEIVNGDNTLANILKEKISQQKGVSACSFNIEHPLVSNPKFVVEADNVKKAIESAINELQKDNASLQKLFEKI